METDELIAALAADATPAKRPRLIARAVIGALCTVVLVLVLYGLRPDLSEALKLGPVQAKHFFTLFVLAGLTWLLTRAPVGQRANMRPLWIAGAAIVVLWGGAAAMGSDPMGQTALACFVSIPLLALPVIGLMFAGLRHRVEPFAAERGFLTGLFAGAVSASIYAVHCIEDAPAFFLLWYTAGIVVSGVIGHLIGKRVLSV